MQISIIIVSWKKEQPYTVVSIYEFIQIIFYWWKEICIWKWTDENGEWMGKFAEYNFIYEATSEYHTKGKIESHGHLWLHSWVTLPIVRHFYQLGFKRWYLFLRKCYRKTFFCLKICYQSRPKTVYCNNLVARRQSMLVLVLWKYWVFSFSDLENFKPSF